MNWRARIRKATLASILRPGLVLGSRVVPSFEHDSYLRTVRPSVIVDVGANRGQFCTWARLRFPATPILSFEPLPGAFERLREVMVGDPNFEARRLALAARRGEQSIYLTAAQDSSSLLRPTAAQTRLYGVAPGKVVEEQTVQVSTLDEELEGIQLGRDGLLKIDVQGGEFGVLLGGERTLRRVRFVVVEVSMTELYAGQALFDGVYKLLAEKGFRLEKLANPDLDGGKIVQCDALFSNDGSTL